MILETSKLRNFSKNALYDRNSNNIFIFDGDIHEVRKMRAWADLQFISQGVGSNEENGSALGSVGRAMIMISM